ncbi:hypothetical protein LWC34_42665 [Kibdelosporangium philippinense]|uniref:YfhO family protein n=1 Tax=Kibdelosporangium philippinense TaxID=211113 RepID=A0ABS8ZP25_9PSEU|nr:hypothetical protein [Kibdelosporangium philippinense]MCE7009470.1 hypothetical protein [Kibdelosporangium philippinense]
MRPGEGATGRSVPEWLWVIAIGLIGAVVFLIPYLQTPYFYYVGDNPESFVPNWYHYGQQVLNGVWPTVESSGWYGGNYIGEAAASTWNPFFVLCWIIVAQFNSMTAAAAFVMIAHLCLLTMGTYLLAREYGAARVSSTVFAFAIPLTGFTLYYEAAGWPAGLSAFVWVTWFWWAARRFSRGASSPLLPFLLGAMAMTVGNPYAALGMIIVLAAIAIELLVNKNVRGFVQLAIVGACVGAVAVLVFFPLLGAMPVSSRQELAMIANDTFLVPGVGDLLTASAPSYLPAILNWGGQVKESLPSTYFVWFAIPLLPWLRWRTLLTSARSLISVGVVGGVYAILTFGPSNLWLFRWPIRLIEYLYLAVAVVFAVLLSKGLAKDKIRGRTMITIGLVGIGAYLSFAVRPEFYALHAVSTVLVLVFFFGALWAYRKRGWMALGIALLIGTMGIAAYQTNKIPAPGVDVTPWIVPASDINKIKAGTAEYKGTVLQLASQGLVKGTSEQDDGEVAFGNLSVLNGHESITRYSGIGFTEFTAALCMDYKGSVCPDAYRKAFAPVPGTDITLVDALRVQTLVLQDALFPNVVNSAPPRGWTRIAQSGGRTVWTRDAPLPYPGRVSWASRGVTVASSTSESATEQVKFSAPAGGGQLIFARLDWPGYSATVDGKTAEVRNGDAGLITIDVPAGEHTLSLDYETPGLRLGVTLLGGATLVVLIQTLWWWRTTRRRADATQEKDTENGVAEDASPVLTHT